MPTVYDWLASVYESAVEPELPIIDTHHHLWDVRGSRYLLDELVADTAGHNVRQTVFVECESMYRADGPEELKPVGETEFVGGIAAQSASGQFGEMRAATGIVGTADLTLGAEVASVLEAHIEASPARFRGIRHRTAWAEPGVQRNAPSGPNPHLMANTKFREGFARLADYGLSFDAWLYHPQLPELVELAAAFPNTPIVLNHLGGPIGVGPDEAGARKSSLNGSATSQQQRRCRMWC